MNDVRIENVKLKINNRELRDESILQIAINLLK